MKLLDAVPGMELICSLFEPLGQRGSLHVDLLPRDVAESFGQQMGNRRIKMMR